MGRGPASFGDKIPTRNLGGPRDHPSNLNWGGVQKFSGPTGSQRGATVHGGEKKKADGDGKTFGNPTERKAHGQLKNGGEDGKSGLRTPHEVLWHDGHER